MAANAPAASSSKPYKLSNQLQGHRGDVRAVAAFTPPQGSALILSASRDKTACVWSRLKGNRHFEPPDTLEGHGGYVNSCAWLSEPSGQLFALTGGQDKLINAFDVRVASDGGAVASSTPQYTLPGHEDNISTLDVGPAGSYIVSGSWDKTARVWKNWECVATFKGHLQAVWAVLAVDEDRVITASADKIIRLWSISNPAEPIAIFGGHGDAVRGLQLLPGSQSFVSCSNDGTINHYSLVNLDPRGTNKPVRASSGHTSFVYSLAALSDSSGQIVSSGEDRSVRVWTANGELVQTLTIPAISVWAVAALEDGDLICGSSDAFLRIFTRDAARVADADEIEAYDRSIASQALNKTQVGDVRKDDVPGKEALAQPGTKEGQTKMVNNGSVIEAYQWSMASGQWEKVGEVVGGVGSGQKKLFEGKEYDYVFDVDIADDAPPLKLPYNLSENAYAAAQRFLERNELPMSYMEQVVQFIDKNTEALNIGGSQSSYVDPYHEGRYIPGAAQNSAPVETSASATSGPAATTLKMLPVSELQSFRQANLPALESKLTELGASEPVGANVSVLTPGLATALSSGTATQPLDVACLQEAVNGWQPASKFPLLDLLRLTALFPTTASPSALIDLVLTAAGWTEDWPVAGSSEVRPRETNTMLAARALANLLFSSNTSRTTHRDEVLSSLSAKTLGSATCSSFSRFNKNGRIAFATVLFNASALLVKSNDAVATVVAPALLDSIVRVLTEEEAEEEVVYRTLIAFGNLVVTPTTKAALPVGNVQLARDAAEAWAQRFTASRRVQDVYSDITTAAGAI
ncbi:unnamed protein product [Parajaminaea phylloscopi]